ncbi:MAG: hypothetical protein GXP30_04230 [Verrucomicrobia bacterium]|nr:hypothetical protein [Verrucomicrobiota bacterium]
MALPKRTSSKSLRKTTASSTSGRRKSSHRKKASGSKKRHKSSANNKQIAAFVEGDAIPIAAPSDGLLHWMRLLIGLALLPFVWISLESFFLSFAHATKNGAFWRTGEFWFFTIGSSIWLVLFFGLRSRLMLWLYVAGHELTHAVFVLFCGGNVKGLHISSSGGHILTNKNNFIIALSPYFIPFYTMIVIALWWIIQLIFPDYPITVVHDRILFASIGLTWTFHLTFTLWMINREQPDLQQNGILFSVALIALINILLISGFLVLASPHVTLEYFALTWANNLATFHDRLMESVREMIHMVM